MSELIATLKQKAKAKQKTIVLPETYDERVLKAAGEILQNKMLKKIILIGDKEEITSKAAELKISLEGSEFYNPKTSELTEKFSKEFYEKRSAKGITEEQAEEAVKNNLIFSAFLVNEGIADGMVAGSTAATADVIRSGLYVIGLKQEKGVISSFFIMDIDNPLVKDNILIYADCGVIPEPNPRQLARIAIDTADNAKKLLDIDEKIAFLSFSTKGSAKHRKTDKVLQALEMAKTQRPDLKMDGELQFDAALIESIGKRKAPDSEIAGKANIMIFPDLDAGNIAYKITERLANAKAIGPILQGLKKPINDLSRGCSYEDIVNVCAITALQA